MANARSGQGPVLTAMVALGVAAVGAGLIAATIGSIAEPAGSSPAPTGSAAADSGSPAARSACDPALAGSHAVSASADSPPDLPLAPVGVAKVDITPETPVRMYGYASRKTESEGVAGRLKAAALALGGDEGDGPAVLLTVDCGAVPAEIRLEVLRRLQADVPLKPERLMLCNAHIHSGPNLKGLSSPTSDERRHIDEYARLLTDRLEKVTREALRSRRPGRLAWGRGSVSFAANRRVLKDGKWSAFGAVPGAPADHSLPVLRATDAEGNILAVLVNYACHNTTLRPDFKQIHGDWAGCAQDAIEADHPGAVAMTSLGCGADADPYPHGTLDLCSRHGRSVADEVKRVLEGSLKPIAPKLEARAVSFEISCDPSRAPRSYSVATWTFGDGMAMVFLENEVVVDIGLRLKREFDESRLWVNAYANDVSGYVVSQRLIGEGGYEPQNSLSAQVSDGHPERVQPPVDDRIAGAVRELLPVTFRAPAQRKRRILYNLDGCSSLFLKKGVYAPGPIAEPDLRAVVDELTEPGSQVDTLLVCFNAQVTFYPSQAGTMVGSLVPAERRAGWTPGSRQWVSNLESFHARGVDPYAVILARARERGLEALLSCRMNDAHEGQEGSPLRSKLWLERPECRLGYGLDFGRDEAREHTFRIIEEAVRRYDCDGLELDFNRFPTYFSGGDEADRIEKIARLVERVRRALDEEGPRRGRRLALAARVPTSYEACRRAGLDPAIWAERGLIDFLTVSEFLHVRYDLPVAPWKKLIRTIPIYGSIETAHADRSGPRLGYLSADDYRRAARHLHTDGADGIYLFNFFCPREEGSRGFEPPFEVLKELGAAGR